LKQFSDALDANLKRKKVAAAVTAAKRKKRAAAARKRQLRGDDRGDVAYHSAAAPSAAADDDGDGDAGVDVEKVEEMKRRLAEAHRRMRTYRKASKKCSCSFTY
jgi:hypothetical protein